MAERRTDQNGLTYWFPLIEAAALPVPRTTIIPMSAQAQEELGGIFDNQETAGTALATFIETMQVAATDLGFPCFLRSSHTSNKHEWDKACFLRSADDMREHVINIAYFSECADLMGLPWGVWALREFLPTIPLGVCPGYDNFPICREFRFFVDGAKVRCWHPYWPFHALEQGSASSDLDYAALCRMDNEAELSVLASRAGAACGGSWSVDILETRRGWFVTDMAVAERSYHWEGCPHA